MMSLVDKVYEETLANMRKDSLYKRVSVLGSSPYTLTELVRNTKDARLYVRKEFVFNSLDDARIRKDFFNVLKKNRFVNCANCIDVYLIADKLVVISEYVDGTNLYDFIKRCEVEQVDEVTFLQCLRVICKDLAAAFRSLAKSAGGIVHRDINPNNIIIGHGCASLIDFGIARCFVDGKCADTQLFGTNGYAAPEQYGFGQTNQRSDVFALGMLLYFCLTHAQPSNILAREYVDIPKFNAFNDPVRRAISFNPDDRYETPQAFFAEIDTAFADEINRLEPKQRVLAPRESRSTLHNVLISSEAEAAAPQHGRVYNALRLMWNSAQYLFFFFLAISFVWEAFAPGEIMGTKHPLMLGLASVIYLGIPSFFSLDFFQVYKKIPYLSRIRPLYFWPSFVALWIAAVCAFAQFVPEL